jgi:hypothetical protein
MTDTPRRPPTKWTGRAKLHIAVVRAMLDKCEKDMGRTARLKSLECPSCYYLRGGRIAGQAFTKYNCKVHGAELEALARRIADEAAPPELMTHWERLVSNANNT